jgi:hypothetical protein
MPKEKKSKNTENKRENWHNHPSRPFFFEHKLCYTSYGEKEWQQQNMMKHL